MVRPKVPEGTRGTHALLGGFNQSDCPNLVSVHAEGRVIGIGTHPIPSARGRGGTIAPRCVSVSVSVRMCMCMRMCRCVEGEYVSL